MAEGSDRDECHPALYTVLLAYTLIGKQTSADLIGAIKQIGAEIGEVGNPVPLDQMVLSGNNYGSTAQRISMSAESTRLDLAALDASLGDLLQTDELSEADSEAAVADPKRSPTLKPIAKAADDPAE